MNIVNTTGYLRGAGRVMKKQGGLSSIRMYGEQVRNRSRCICGRKNICSISSFAVVSS